MPAAVGVQRDHQRDGGTLNRWGTNQTQSEHKGKGGTKGKRGRGGVQRAAAGYLGQKPGTSVPASTGNPRSAAPACGGPLPHCSAAPACCLPAHPAAPTNQNPGTPQQPCQAPGPAAALPHRQHRRSQPARQCFDSTRLLSRLAPSQRNTGAVTTYSKPQGGQASAQNTASTSHS